MTTAELCHVLAYAHDKQLGLTTLHALAYISIDGEAKISQVAKHVGVTSAAITGTADRLVALGLVTRRYSTADRRSIWLDITPAGNAVMAKALYGPLETRFAEAI